MIYCGINWLPGWCRPNVMYLKNGDGYMFQRLAEADSTQDIDVLFLGSSHTYQGYNPAYFSPYKVFNLGSSNQTHVQTQWLLHKYLEQLKPQLIVYEINPNMLYNDDTESSVDIISNSSQLQEFTSMVHTENAFQLFHTYVYRCMDKIWPSTQFSQPANNEWGDKYIGAGFVEKNKTQNSHFDPATFITIPTHINSYSWTALQANIQKIQAAHIPLVLVFTPVTRGFYNFHGQESKIDTILNTYPRIPYYNYNTLYTWNDTLDFYDEHHLNAQGVKKYNQYILQLIDSVFNKKEG